jgi:hypothetical protein
VLADCLDSYFLPQAELPVWSPPATAVTALLDALPDIGVAAAGTSITRETAGSTSRITTCRRTVFTAAPPGRRTALRHSTSCT